MATSAEGNFSLGIARGQRGHQGGLGSSGNTPTRCPCLCCCAVCPRWYQIRRENKHKVGACECLHVPLPKAQENIHCSGVTAKIGCGTGRIKCLTEPGSAPRALSGHQHKGSFSQCPRALQRLTGPQPFFPGTCVWRAGYQHPSQHELLFTVVPYYCVSLVIPAVGTKRAVEQDGTKALGACKRLAQLLQLLCGCQAVQDPHDHPFCSVGKWRGNSKES